ncbi:MAG: shikimate dehydrogenase [Pseudomonadota bacterium]
MTKLAAVIGDPIAHSRSPRLHGHWVRRYGIDGHYIPLHVRSQHLEETLNLLPKLGFSGSNVTLPHKEAAFELAHEATDRAKAVGAANTLTFADGRILADNTDGSGFTAALLQSAGPVALSMPTVILGAGGAARGIIAALLDAGVPDIRIANRTEERAETLAALFDDRVRSVDWTEPLDGLVDPSLLVNTTSLGMTGHPGLDIDLNGLLAGSVVSDIVYTPLETPLLAAARTRGLVAVDGLGMLLHQAVPGFERWFGIRPEVDDALRRAVLA